MEEAKKAFQKGEVPVGCVVVKEGQVVAKAHNRVQELKDPTAHAEMLAIREATKALDSKYLYGCEVYVSLEPCPHVCLRLGAFKGRESNLFCP